ncbi:MAG: hypothetical protein KZQ77_13735, partial [Candidatus Thiodiazotropha sp. (ex Notomyrtea botanica)]|nr:hypothetical protein [Candidatus Thiodiazotropha sp. (ex Notomyrtea botanica)]
HTGTGDLGEPLIVPRFKCHHGHGDNLTFSSLLHWSIAQGFREVGPYVRYARFHKDQILALVERAEA